VYQSLVAVGDEQGEDAEMTGTSAPDLINSYWHSLMTATLSYKDIITPVIFFQ